MPLLAPPFQFNGLVTFSFVNRLTWAGRNADVEATSWWRSPAENARVGGDLFSQHLVGWALDVVGPGSQDFAKRARIAGLTVVTEPTHVHVQVFPKGILRTLFQ